MATVIVNTPGRVTTLSKTKRSIRSGENMSVNTVCPPLNYQDSAYYTTDINELYDCTVDATEVFGNLLVPFATLNNASFYCEETVTLGDVVKVRPMDLNVKTVYFGLKQGNGSAVTTSNQEVSLQYTSTTNSGRVIGRESGSSLGTIQTLVANEQTDFMELRLVDSGIDIQVEFWWSGALVYTFPTTYAYGTTFYPCGLMTDDKNSVLRIYK